MELSQRISSWLQDASLPLITFRRLALHRKISFDEAKTALDKFADEHGDEFDVVYWVSVTETNPESSSATSNLLVEQKDLEDVKKQYGDVKIDHVYSIGKKSVKKEDENAVDCDQLEQNVWNVDKELRSETSKASGLRAVINPQVVVKEASSTQEDESKVVGEESSSQKTGSSPKKAKIEVKQDTKEKTKVDTTSTEDKHKGNHTDDLKKKESLKHKTVSKGIVANKSGSQKNALKSMFANAKSKPKKEAVAKTEEKEESKKSDAKEDKMDTQNRSTQESAKMSNNASKKRAASNSRSSSNSGKKDVKRKRIQVMSDSSEEDEDDEEEAAQEANEDEAPPQAALIESDEEDALNDSKDNKSDKENDQANKDDDESDTIPVTPSSPKTRTKLSTHRVRRLVTKTYLDDKGFMITRKEMQSDDEEDTVQEPKPIVSETLNGEEKIGKKDEKGGGKREKKSDKNDKEINKKKSEPGGHKSKQAAITNFFVRSKV